MRWLVIVVLALVAAGCGDVHRSADETIRAQMAKVQTTCAEGINCGAPVKPPSGHSCEPAGAGARGSGYRTCWGPNPNHPNPTIERKTSSGWALVTGPLKPHDVSAQWGAVWVSPDRRTLLAEWQYPCDSAAVAFVPATGGIPRLVTGEQDWRNAPIARGVGWTRDGKARVRLYTSWRGYRIEPRHPRLFLFDPDAPMDDAKPVEQFGC